MAWKMEGLEVKQSCFGLNVMRYEVTARYCPCPVAVAYVSRHGTDGNKVGAELLYMFVVPQARRQGVGTLLHNKITEENDVVQTLGTTKVGAKFIASLGYAYCDAIDMYLWHK